jgi:hypothetical protein
MDKRRKSKGLRPANLSVNIPLVLVRLDESLVFWFVGFFFCCCCCFC